ncbi:MAG TPA: bifunctional 3-phosphoshikimate 1-carboxyvinyltransferase/cytidylate kinase [Ottowia sp.]|uniref:bifunctional 3-phosphoshikimate 1-carboxyvinyltransferase/cytidylate kinase n=1 Tax=Ottowia sp. TaxID=1898956 RepID=UPI002CCAE252|nr:bifunctional 3-phosphoshikimate 1-carboxyvinyltransferase/cytidylate kinase [Ottowia sp.]MCZ2088085.1 bifunctional 3-phosphoshikimate 1-carboxyvinyltransferase/cytidylate kinase [Burkholderiales bacterium]HNI84468.1 bifunctional 3-phosphoshikimate 1-carboxyvinyltransferase/cytidylate kinase [Ottowia sp.]HNJ45650.1 bifunctional 3-phosphoshikimate 1-carboxyvinyltransferase/cytidylate kinase [Ottowia sp.]HNN34020.1 bifunctional 3-phosphoshikimate 1-carboxyvinyltransferase/cytidylate kinase [Ott
MFDLPFLDIPALRAVHGTVRLPGSKSISNRVLLLAALCEGRTVIHDLLDSDDTRVMLQALRQLGCVVELQGTSHVIEGLGSRPRQPQAELFLGNAGTAMRPLTAALAVLGGDYRLSGIPRMHERPIGDLVDALRTLGCRIDYLGQAGYPPLRIGAPDLSLDRPIPVRGDVSSQFLTALLLALPLAAGRPGARDIVIDVVGELISKPYIDITLQLLARFGVTVQRQGWQRFVIPSGSRYRSPGEIHVEADASSASYFIAAGALSEDAAGQNGLTIEGVGEASIQGDIRFVEAARQMGAQIESGPNWLRVRRGAWPLRAIDLDGNHIPDAAMTLAVMALYADGPSTLRNIASWRVKETDRIAAMANELRKLGAQVEEGADFIRIHPPAGAAAWRAASIHTYDDHRMAMCGSLAAFNPAGLPVRIEDPRCVGKTFPDYFETLFALAGAAGPVPVICIDGPTASGKGTLAAELARRLGFRFLDSGALYRLVGLAARQQGMAPDATNEAALASLARQLPVRFEAQTVWLADQDVTDAIRTEAAGMDASRVSALPAVRQALLALQRDFARLPGLVADGRDMGTVVFPDARLKVFLTADAAQRAERRYKQLISKGISANIDSLRADLEARDARDRDRAAAPLKAAPDALLLDNSLLSIAQSVEQVLSWWQARQPF